MTPEKNKNISIKVNEDNLRIDKFLSNYFLEQGHEISRTNIKEMIKLGLVILNGVPVKKSSQMVYSEDIILYPEIPPIKEENLIPENIPLDIIFEDEHILIINKSCNLVVHPAAGHPNGTLVNAVLFHLKSRLPETDDPLRPGIVHRLDKDTTGLMIIAKTNQALTPLQKMIKNREIIRIYLTMVHGVPQNAEARIETPFGKSMKDRKKYSVNTRKARLAVSEYSLIQKFKNFAYLKFKLITGRTHQIRVHMSYLGHPVVGDLVYGKDRRKVSAHDRTFKFKQHLLHSTYLEFQHPVSGEIFRFESPVPDQFQEFLSFLLDKEYGRKTI